MPLAAVTEVIIIPFNRVTTVGGHSRSKGRFAGLWGRNNAGEETHEFTLSRRRQPRFKAHSERFQAS